MYKRQIIDFAILALYLYVAKTFLYDFLELNKHSTIGLDMAIITLPMLLYSLICETAMNGQTFGKKLMNIRVISIEGGEPVLGQYLLRWITRFFEWPFLFGYIVEGIGMVILYAIITGMFGMIVVFIIAITKYNQRLGDLLAGTVVVNTKTELTINDTVFMNVADENYTVSFPEVMRLSDNDINTIKSVLVEARKKRYDLAYRVEARVKEVLNVESPLHVVDFLEKLLEDYNYLATRER